MLILENAITLSAVEAAMEEAKSRFALVENVLDKDDINKIIQNLVESEPAVAVALGALNESMQLNEFMVKHVSSKGELTRTKDHETRKRQALQTTGLSKSERRRIARKASKTKRANPSGQSRAKKKFKKAIGKRKMYGLD